MNYEDLQEKLKLARDEQNKGNYDTADKLCNELLASIAGLSNDRQQEPDWRILSASATNTLGLSAQRRGDYSTALDFFNTALDTYTQVADQPGIAKATGNIGLVYDSRSDYLRALEYYGKALEMYEQLGDKHGVAINTGNIGTVYQELSDYARALEYYGKSLEMFEQLGNKAGVARNTSNIGNVYGNLSDYPRALEYYGKALEMKEQLGNKAGVAGTTSNIGYVYNALSDYPRAMDYFAKSLEINEQIGSKAGVATDNVNIGTVYNSRSDYLRALEYYGKSLEMYELLGDKHGVALNTGNIGMVYAEEKFEGCDFAKAEKWLLKAIAINQELGTKNLIYKNNKALAELYEKQKRWEEFAVHYKKYHEIEKEVQSEEARRAAENYTIGTAIAEQQREAELQKLKAQQLQHDMKRQQETLSHKTLQIVQQTEMLENFRHEIEGIVHHADSAEKAVRAIRQKLKELPQNVVNWWKFSEEFNEVHPDFEAKLKVQYPSLTRTEIRVCCLLRIGMITREIATLLYVSERTVEGHRLNLRQKFQADGGLNLQDVLENIA